MYRNEPLLHVCSRATFFRTTYKHAHRSRVDCVEKILFCLVRICVVDKSNLVFGNATLDEFMFQVVICVEVCSIHIFRIRLFRSRQITKHKLRPFNICRVLPFFVNIVGAIIEFASAFVGKQRIDAPRIERELLSIARNFEHIVDMRINATCVNRVCPFRYFFGQVDYRIARL